jgi:hypothetical protein
MAKPLYRWVVLFVYACVVTTLFAQTGPPREHLDPGGGGGGGGSGCQYWTCDYDVLNGFASGCTSWLFPTSMSSTDCKVVCDTMIDDLGMDFTCWCESQGYCYTV